MTPDRKEIMSNDRWNEAIQRVLARIEDTARRVGDRFPHWANTDTGEWVTTADGDWTGGYYVGMHWLALKVAPDAAMEARAHNMAEVLRARIEAFLALPLESLKKDKVALKAKMDRIADITMEEGRNVSAK